jgi:predicted phage gp36 major capsid-like protein
MARRSLRPHLNQIRSWVRQGRTDAWIAHQLEVTVQQIEAFKKENELLPDGEGGEAPGVDFDDEIDLRAEDDALIAAELEAEAARQALAGEQAEDEDEEAEEDSARRRRGRRGGRGRRRRTTSGFEATFDHGEEGYGLWLDPAVADDPVYAEHWAGHRQIEVTIEPDQIVIRRAGANGDDD